MSEGCIVCGKSCGPLRGQAKSWQCAGVLSYRTRTSGERREELRRRFGNVAKQAARNVMLPDLLALRSGTRVLDLYGGGLSAEWMLRTRPDVNLVVAERDRSLWPAMRADAKRLGFQPVFGDVEKAGAFGPFGFVYLDLCSEPLGAFAATREVVQMLAGLHAGRVRAQSHEVRPNDEPSALYVTVLRQNRQGYAELKLSALDIAVRALLDEAAGIPFAASKVHSYPQAGGKGLVDLWMIGHSYADQAKWIERARQRHHEDRDWHRRNVVGFYSEEWLIRTGTPLVRGASDTHARGTCRCAYKGYVSYEELAADRERHWSWVRAGHPEFPPGFEQPEALAA